MAFGGVAANGSYFQSSFPVAASRATTFTRGLQVVTYMTPSMTIGVHSIVLPLPGAASPVW